MEHLRTEVQRLERYKAIVEGEVWTAKHLARVLALIWVSPGLAVAIQRWLEARRAADETFPLPETAELAAALLRRFLRVGAIAVVLAILPTLLLVWQNTIMLDQNQYLRQQIAEMRGQAESMRLQAIDTQIANYFGVLTSREDGKFWAAVAFFRSSEAREA